MKLFFTFLLTATTLLWSQAQNYQFAVHAGGSSYDAVMDFKADASGNSYALIQGKTDFAFGEESLSGLGDFYQILKYDSEGNLSASKLINTTKFSGAKASLGVANNGAIFYGGYISSNEGTDLEFTTALIKINSEMGFDWVFNFKSIVANLSNPTNVKVEAIMVAEDAIYVGANFDYADFDDHASILKFDFDGNLLWNTRIPLARANYYNYEYIGGGVDQMIMAADGNLIIAGKSGDSSYNDWELQFLMKMTTDGEILWNSQSSSVGADTWGVVETSTGEIIVGFDMGSSDSVDFRTGMATLTDEKGYVGMLAYFDQNGTVTKYKQFSEIFVDPATILYNNFITIEDMSITENDELIFAGQAQGNLSLIGGASFETSPGLLGGSKDACILLTDTDLAVQKYLVNTGRNNERIFNCQIKGDTILFAGTYDTFSHPFYGVMQPDFGGTTFGSVGGEDVFIASAVLTASETAIQAHTFNNIEIEVFPNPVVDQLSIKNISNDYQNIQLYSLKGDLIRSLNLKKQESIQFDMTDLNNGIYFLRTQSSTIKIIKK